MGDKLVWRLADVEDVPELVEHMRPLDRQEMLAISGERLHDTLVEGIKRSYLPRSYFAMDGKLVCIAGAVPPDLLGDFAVPWMIGTVSMMRHPGALTRFGREYIDTVRELYPKLLNYVDERNLPSVRWLKRLGFTIEPAQPIGLNGEPFHPFHIGF